MRKSLAILVAMFLPMVAVGDDDPAMIWVAEGTNNRVFFLGSIHLLREQDHPLPSIIESVYNEADRIVMELDMDDIDPIGLFGTLSAMGKIKDGGTLRDLMGPEMYAEAEAAAAETDIPINMLAQSEPWLAAMTVQEILMHRSGFRAEKGIEMHLTSMALGDSKPIEGLETVEEQLGFLDGLSLDTQNRWFLYSMAEGPRIELLIDDIVDAWRRGDADYVAQELLHDMDSYPELHQALLVQRNKNWVAAVLEMLESDEDYLVVVGAAHLVGEDGLPDLLSKQGVRIKQLHESLR